MIVYKGVYENRLAFLIAINRLDLAHMLSGEPMLFVKKYNTDDLPGPDIIIKFVESPQEAARYAHEILTKGERL